MNLDCIGENQYLITDDNKKSFVKFLYTKNNSKSLNFDNCTKIKAGCFKNTTGIEIIFINSDSTLEIEECAFENSFDLKTVVIGEKIEETNQNETTTISKVIMQSNTFKNCNSLEYIHIKSNEVTIESNAFSQCYNLRVVVIESDNISFRKDSFESSDNLCISSKDNTLKDFCCKNNIDFLEI